jgi:peptide/nickel transport system substrate-binding protein
VYLVEYETAAEILNAFEDSYIDIALNDPSSYSSLGFASTDETHAFATTNMHYVVINHQSDAGKYVAFRFAMNYAFDRDYFANMLMSGNAVASSVPMHPNCSLYPSALADSLDYNIPLCKRILENGGIMDYDEDGKLEIMQGAPDLTLTFVVCSDSSAKNGVVRRFANDMEEIGITVEINALPWDEYIEALENGEFDLYYGEMKLRADFDVTEFFDIRTKDNENYNINYSGNTDPTFEQYINAYLSSPEGTQKAKYIDMVKYITDDGGLITIGFEKQQLITHRGIVRGVAPNAGNPLYGFANWQITLG